LLGLIAEEVLRTNVINMEMLHMAILKYYGAYSVDERLKIIKSKTTQAFIEILARTRAMMDTVIRGNLQFDTTVQYGSVEGHPDAQTETQIFEVKLTGLLKKNWVDFLLQIFAYGAIHSEATDIYLVLPLQETVWTYSLSNWNAREQYRDALQMVSKPIEVSAIPGQILQMTHNIGSHIRKEKTIASTMLGILPMKERPFQVFLSGPQTTKIVLKDEDVAASAEIQMGNNLQMYVHSPYIINLCQEPGTKDDYSVVCLIKTMEHSVAMGMRGVVVHVGKSTTMDVRIAEEHMRQNIMTVLEYATEECPLLLETPAGQGTEMLKTYGEFLTFVCSFKSTKLRVCIDTCHVFATGQSPYDYITSLHTVDPSMIKLVHFNDSAAACGTCVDRHAYIGMGYIGFDEMKKIADYCKKCAIAMLVE
jgi:deoxyribonuclease-4